MRKIALIAIFGFLAGSVRADQQLSLQLAPTTRVPFANGLTLLVRERHGTGRVGIYLMMGAGQITEDESKMGITNLLQNYLLDVPFEKYHDASSAVQAKGGVIGSTSGPDFSDIDLDIPSGALGFSMRVLGGIVHTKQIDQTAFDRVKDSTLAQIRQGEIEGKQALYNIFLQQFYTFHPYREPVYGTAGSVKNINALDLKEYFNRYYVPNNMVIAVVGDVDTDRVIQLANRYFSDLTRRPLASKNIYYQPILDETKEIPLEAGGNMAELFMGFSAPPLRSPDYAPMEAINSVLGAGLSSRIWLAIREKRGLAYSLGSEYDVRQGPSHFIIYVTTSQENLRESKSRLIGQIARIRSQPLGADEMAIVKRRLIGQFILSLETDSAQAQYAAWSELAGKGINYYQEYLSEINALTPVDLLRVAKKYLDDYILISVN